MVIEDLHRERRTLTLDEAFRTCEQISEDHYENFPVASRFIPKEKRKYVCAIYAFARTADDFADEPGLTPAERVDLIDSWENQLVECMSGGPASAVFRALKETIERFQIPVGLFHDLLHAFRRDVTVHRYKTFDEVLDYCRYSANPVGRLVLHLFGYGDQSLLALSDSICTALQLANFWQDVAVDLDKDRLYVPAEDLRRFGYSEEQLIGREYNSAFRRLLAFEVDRTRELFHRGKPLLSSVGKDLSFELKLTWHGGMRVLKKIEQHEYNVFENRLTLSAFDIARVFLSSLLVS